MQKKKEYVENAIINAAKMDFIDKGFQGASMRSIAKRSGISLSNIYNYFKCKDEIFEVVISPVIKKINSGKIFMADPASAETVNDLESHLEIMNKVIQFVEDNKDILKMILFRSNGSGYETYADDLTDWYTDLSMGYIPVMCKEWNMAVVEFDRFIIHNIAGLWIQFFREALMHDISGNKLINSANDMMAFMYSGWCGMFERKKK